MINNGAQHALCLRGSTGVSRKKRKGSKERKENISVKLRVSVPSWFKKGFTQRSKKTINEKQQTRNDKFSLKLRASLSPWFNQHFTYTKASA